MDLFIQLSMYWFIYFFYICKLLSCSVHTVETIRQSELNKRWTQRRIPDSDVMSGLLHNCIDVCGRWFQFWWRLMLGSQQSHWLMGEQHLLPGQNEPVPTGQDLRHSNTRLVSQLFLLFDCLLEISIYTMFDCKGSLCLANCLVKL